MPRRRVVVTGLGLVTPVGNTVKESWGNILAGKQWHRLDRTFRRQRIQYAFRRIEVKDFDVSPI